MTQDEYSELYACFCDTICRDQLSIEDDDPMMHTSEAARAVATMLFETLDRYGLIDFEDAFGIEAK